MQLLKYGKYLANIMDDSVIKCDEIIDAEAKSYNEETETVPINFNEKDVAFKTQNFYILFAFFILFALFCIFFCIFYYIFFNYYSILFLAVIIYCCLIKD